MKWVLKAIVQKTISFLPNSQKLNYWFQKHVTKGVDLSDDYLEDRLIHFQHHLRHYQELKGDNAVPDTVLELGTGWYPIIPICYYLAGSEKIYTVDISPLADGENISLSVQRIIEWYKQGRLNTYFEPEEERINRLMDLADRAGLDDLNINYLIEDARKLSLDDKSVAFVSSNNTFEHVYPNILKGILIEFKRVLKNDGAMSHFIDLSDHFAHLDSSITIYNFLKFSESAWKRIDNSVQPQNRWRMIQYKGLYRELEIQILKEDNRPGNIEEVRSLKLSSPFKEMQENEVAISHGYLVS